MKKLRIYQYSIIAAMTLLLGLNIYFIVRSILWFNPNTHSVSDLVIFMISLVVVTILTGANIMNTFFSMKQGSSFLKPLVYDDDTTLNKKFIYFCYFAEAVAIGVIVYFILILCGLPLYFSTFPTPMIYLITNVFALLAVDIIFIVLFPVFGTSDLAFSKKNRK